MDEHISCRQCEHENSPDNRFCRRCGASLTSTKQLVPRRENSPTTVIRALPSKLGPTGKTLAVGMAALVAEAGLLWLRRRVERAERAPLTAASRDAKPAAPDHLIGQSLEEVYVWLQEGDHQRRILARRETRLFGSARSTDVRE
jgi:ribosomal protein L40E